VYTIVLTIESTTELTIESTIQSIMKALKDALAEIKYKNRPKNLSKEFQVYGVYLAEALDDPKHYSLYIKLAKEHPRGILEEALTYTKGYYSAKNKARVFMWRLKELKKYS
jgi:hypothetical protein